MLPVDALLDSCPSRLITRRLRRSLGEPVPVVRTLVSEPSRLPLREVVRRVLCPQIPTPQGVSRTFLHIPRVPACPQQAAGRLSPEPPGLSPDPPRACGGTTSPGRPRTRPRSRATDGP